jgi:hypothetical protein
MRRSFVRRTARASLVVAAALVAVALVAGEAVAFHTVSHSGTRGHFSFVDTPTMPGARCNYEGAAGHGFLDAIRVKPPKVFWPNLTSANPHEQGLVGWQVRIQHWNGATWTTTDTSSQDVAIAHEHTPAPFVAIVAVHNPPNSLRYRALAVLTWFRPNSSVLGRAKVVLDWYNQTDPGKIVPTCKGVVCHVCATVPSRGPAADAARARVEAIAPRRS